ncbi:MAG: RcnB family protein [Hyphomicrobiales bacterium]|nr:RcnB family protein [Hyphomicrobiales bacterium]
MVRKFVAFAAVLALALPTVAMAEDHQHPAGKPAPHGPPAHGPAVRVVPHGPGPVGHPNFAGPHGPVPGPHGAQFSYRGHNFNRVHMAPFAYPHGWHYRRWGIGMILPPLFLAPAYYYGDWAGLGLPPPEPGFQWVRYGPDLLLVNVMTGQVVDVIYGAFY